MDSEEEILHEDESMEEEEGEDCGDNDDDQKTKEVYLPGKTLQEGEELVCDQSAYVMLHQAQTGAPCLSFDVIRDDLGDDRETKYPLTSYIVAGTQAAKTHLNSVIVMKMSNLHRTGSDAEAEGDDAGESDSENEDDTKRPLMTCALLRHQGCVNRIRSTRLGSTVVAATWSELGRVNVWNLEEPLRAVENPPVPAKYREKAGDNSSPLFSFSGHQKEGFAIDWCQTSPGVLATGDCKRDIHIWTPDDSGSWRIDQRPLIGHTESVEDLQWSPNERHILASCSVDRSICIWDTRAAPNKACKLRAEGAHQSDVNVISWNKNEPFIVSGGDDGFLHIWDLRQFQSSTPVATFKHHTDCVTTVEWHPKESTVFASGGADNQVALWDLSVERDDEAGNADEEVNDIPPQLLFIHQGQNDIKELHWHPQLNGVLLSTAHSGFNIFRTISV